MLRKPQKGIVFSITMSLWSCISCDVQAVFSQRLIINIKQNWQWTAAAKKLKNKKNGSDTIPTVKWNPATAVFQCEHLLQNPRSGISRILLCRMKGGPVVISFTTRNGFVILFDLEASTEVHNGTFTNNLDYWRFYFNYYLLYAWKGGFNAKDITVSFQWHIFI